MIKFTMSVIALLIFIVSCNQKESKTTKSKVKVGSTITAYDTSNNPVTVTVSENMALALNSDSALEECTGGTYEYSATDNPIDLPGSNSFQTFHHLTDNDAGTGDFTISCTANCTLRACVSGNWNPRQFKPGAGLRIWYGQCFAKSQGHIRACRTSYGWRVEGDINKDGKYEAVMKVIF